MLKRLGVVMLGLLVVMQGMPITARAAEETSSSSPAIVSETTTTIAVQEIPTSTVKEAASSSAVIRETVSSTMSSEQSSEETQEDEGDDTIDTTDDNDLDLHKNLEGIVRQSQAYTCGPAALATLISQLGDDTTEADVLQYAPADKETGVSLYALKRAAASLGHAVAVKKWTPEQLADYLKQSEDPVLIHDVKPGVGGHFSVVRDIKDGTAYLSDTEAGNITYSLADFAHVFTGYVLIVDGDVQSALLTDTAADVADDVAATITGKYVPVAIAAANNGASAAANAFTQCMKSASLEPTTQLRRAKQTQCYSTLGGALSQVSLGTEATIAFQAGQSVTGIDMAKDLQYSIDSETFKKLNQEKDSAQSAVSAAQTALQKTQAAVTTAQTVLQQAQTKQQQVLQANAVLQGKKADYQNQLQNKQSTLQALNSQISTAKLNLGSITASISAAATNLGNLSRTLQTKLANTQAQITSKQSTLRSLQQEMTNRQSTINSYNSQIASLQSTINYKKSRRQSYSYEQNQLNSLQYRLQTEQSSLSRAQSSFAQTQRDITNLQQQLNSGSSQVNLEQAALNALKQKQQLAQQDLDRKQAELPRIKNDIAVLTAAIAKLAAPAPVPPVDYNAYNQAVNAQNQAQTAYNAAVTRYNQAVQAIQDEKNFIDAQEKALDNKIEKDVVARPVAVVTQTVNTASVVADVGVAFLEAHPSTRKTTQMILQEINSPLYQMAKGAIVQTIEDGKVCIANAGVQQCLSTCGMIDELGPIAPVCDAVNGVIYLYNGEKIQAGASFFAVIPLVGTLGKGSVKGAIKLSGEAAEVVKTLKVTDEAAIAAKKAAQVSAREVAKSKKIFYNYAQDSINVLEKFSDGGLFAGKTVDDLVADLRAGRILPSQVPLNYIERNGIRVVENTRSVVALERSGISAEKWTWIDSEKTGNIASVQRIMTNMENSKLPSTGIDALKFR